MRKPLVFSQVTENTPHATGHCTDGILLRAVQIP